MPKQTLQTVPHPSPINHQQQGRAAAILRPNKIPSSQILDKRHACSADSQTQGGRVEREEIGPKNTHRVAILEWTGTWAYFRQVGYRTSEVKRFGRARSASDLVAYLAFIESFGQREGNDLKRYRRPHHRNPQISKIGAF